MGLYDHPKWLNDAVFYEIYPQSFYDSNADGIGDIQGIIQKLDYVQALGCNAIWLNPCFDSPFKDAGYDVRDYCKVAERYGKNEDLQELFSKAHERNMHILLDLVPGHTSEEHEWFKKSSQVEENELTQRYIWTDSAFSGYSMPFIGGETPRDATYILNFFKCQPALNYGFAKRDRDWQSSPDSDEARATRQAMVNVMRFWLSRGCDGFRVDMADSLVKNDDNTDFGKEQTIAAWREMLGVIKEEFPQAAFVSEWGRPWQALSAGFDMDFYLNWRWSAPGNGYAQLARNVDNALDEDPAHDHSYFSARGGGSIVGFLHDYVHQYEDTKEQGYFCFITCNHDTPRLAPRLTDRERRIAFGMLLTMPGVPFVYYGDEIGMKYRDLPTKEGGYARTGSRTPMQWDLSQPNAGFSEVQDASQLYLPVETGQSDASVVTQMLDADSFWSWTQALLGLRRERVSLQAQASWNVLFARGDSRAFAYARSAEGQTSIVLMNPSQESITIPKHTFDNLDKHAPYRVLLQVGDVTISNELFNSDVVLGAQSLVILGNK